MLCAQHVYAHWKQEHTKDEFTTDCIFRTREERARKKFFSDRRCNELCDIFFPEFAQSKDCTVFRLSVSEIAGRLG